jgi:hypothetical protein
VGSGNLHNIAGAIVASVPRSHRPMRTSLSTLQGSRLDAARARRYPGGRSCGVPARARMPRT